MTKMKIKNETDITKRAEGKGIVEHGRQEVNKKVLNYEFVAIGGKNILTLASDILIRKTKSTPCDFHLQ